MTHQTAHTIMNQLGGGRFVLMTGAKSFSSTENSISFKIPGKNFAKQSINHVEIVHNPKDTYDMVFSRECAGKLTRVAMQSDVYCDQLQTMFTTHTGLATHL